MGRHRKKVLLNVERYRQHPAECAIAATASLANYYDPSITYKTVRNLVSCADRKKGLWSPHQCRLLNELGFAKVTLVTADLDIIDFAWKRLGTRGLLGRLEKRLKHYKRKKDKSNIDCVDHLINFLRNDDCENKLIIDYNWKKYIKRYLNNDRPVGASFDWTKLHRYDGETEEHSVVLRGYDDEGVFAVDSHWQSYRGKWAKYRNGYYKISWDDFLVNSTGDLILIG